MILGRVSTSSTIVGALSLGVVTVSLYLSPVGASPTHPKTKTSAPAPNAVRNEDSGNGRPVVIRIPGTSTKVRGTAEVTAAKQPRTISPAKVIVVKEELPVFLQTTITTVNTSSAGTTTPTTSPPRPNTFTVPNKTQLVAPTADYWGVSINGVPQGVSQLNALDAEVERAPSELTWYQGWDEAYPAQTVQSSWQRGALPMITWESKPTYDPDPAQADPAYSLDRIISGSYDSYLRTFAQAVKAEGLPVVIRLDQEMNGNWFPWSEGINGNTAGQYAQMWQHVWNIFQAAGANDYVIWLWAPNRVDTLKHAPPLSELYPGDKYVDWIDIDAYWRYTTEAPTFDAVLGESMTELAAVTTKPVFIAETAGMETDPTTGDDVGEDKTLYTSSLFAGIESNSRIIGFSWFDNVATTLENGVPVTNDWRIDSDASNLFAFKSGLESGSFSNGLMPAPGAPVQLAVVPPDQA
jgi:mannan endo-1,4-beta-mannosidase